MEDFKPTEKQLKSLNLFAYYVQSQGCSEATCDLYFYEDGSNLETYDLKYWHCKKGGSFESYESIQEVLEEIVNTIQISDYLEGDDYDARGTLELSIDSKERKLDIRLIETVRRNNEIGTSYEFEDPEMQEKYPAIVEYFNMMEQRGISQGEIQFDGGGDSGEIYSNMSVSGDNDVRVPDPVLDFLYDTLGNFYGGWEINEGSHGDFTFYTKNREIALNFNEHSEDNEDRGKVLHIDF